MNAAAAMAQSGSFELSHLLANVLTGAAAGPRAGRAHARRPGPLRVRGRHRDARDAGAARLRCRALQNVSDMHGGDGQPAIDYLAHLDRRGARAEPSARPAHHRAGHDGVRLHPRRQDHPGDGEGRDLAHADRRGQGGDPRPHVLRAPPAPDAPAARPRRRGLARPGHQHRPGQPVRERPARRWWTTSSRASTDDLAVFSAALERVEKLIADDEAARQRELQSEADSLEATGEGRHRARLGARRDAPPRVSQHAGVRARLPRSTGGPRR